MQSAEVVVRVLRERGRRGLPCNELYRQMFNRDLYLAAYGNIYSNKGAMTPGASGGTADGMSEAEVNQIIGLMRSERYRFSPARRVYIPKKNGKLRPLGMPEWRDKIVGEVVRMLLEAYYEPQFSPRSHGFRKGRGCHTALREIRDTWTGVAWFIEGDISDCFGSLDHGVMLSILAGKIHDNRFLRLVSGMLKAGYLENWEYHGTLSGTPQGSVVSPILSNVYLHKLDEYVEGTLIPRWTRGRYRKRNPEYLRLARKRRRALQAGNLAEARELGKQRRVLPSGNPADPDYRRLLYVRYADDHLLGFAGTKEEAQVIKEDLARFLRETLRLELNREKTLITHARTQRARFLGYDVTVQHNNAQSTNGSRSANGRMALRVPPDVISAKCALYRQHGKPWHRKELQNLHDYDIVRVYGAEYRGIVNYYLMAQNVGWLALLQWNAEMSMLRTLAAKHHSTVAKMAARYKAKIETSDGKRTCFEARKERKGQKEMTSRFGGIPLRPDRRAVIADPEPPPARLSPRELIYRLRKRWCELCENHATVAVHQVSRIADLGKAGPFQPGWASLMARMRRKTLVVCGNCHALIHATPVTHAE